MYVSVLTYWTSEHRCFATWNARLHTQACQDGQKFSILIHNTYRYNQYNFRFKNLVKNIENSFLTFSMQILKAICKSIYPRLLHDSLCSRHIKLLKCSSFNNTPYIRLHKVCSPMHSAVPQTESSI